MSNSCNIGHELIEIFDSPCNDAPDAKYVVRWCKICGAVVIDVDVDNRTSPGAFMKMKFPTSRH